MLYSYELTAIQTDQQKELRFRKADAKQCDSNILIIDKRHELMSALDVRTVSHLTLVSRQPLTDCILGKKSRKSK